MIGKTVKVIIDRPLGTYHPNHKNIFYEVNYGYIEGIIAPDGEGQDCYVLGVDVPIEEFEGQVIAIIHRIDDIEDKWVVAPLGVTFTKEEILEKVNFQEKFFKTEIEM
ncbi:MAG: inorganic pyrophosphatase [Clostridia bacterium]|nr:inorganic pyrophosphatase [Clostridia bacterium]